MRRNVSFKSWLMKLGVLVVLNSCSPKMDQCISRLAVFDTGSAASAFDYEANQPISVYFIENIGTVDIFFSYDDQQVYTSSTPPNLSWQGWTQLAGGPGGPSSSEQILLSAGEVRYFITPLVITRNFRFRSRTGAAFFLFAQWSFSLDDPYLR